MPFNRVQDLKATLNWMLLLEENSTNKTKTKPTYIPGLMLIPMPSLGIILGYIDYSFWAAFLYVVGSVFYVLVSFYGWSSYYPNGKDDSNSPGNYWNTCASVTFLANAIVCIVDWWMQKRQLSLMNLLIENQNEVTATSENCNGVIAVGNTNLKVSAIPTHISWYYFWNNIFFLFASILYVIQAMWMENPRTDFYGCNNGFCGLFWINFFASFNYLISSVFAVMEFLATRQLQIDRNLPPLKLFTFFFKEFDWFGWGDLIYVFASLSPFFQSFFEGMVTQNDDVWGPYYLVGNILFLIDSLLYMIGYMSYIDDLQCAMATGIVQTRNMGPITTLLMSEDDNNTNNFDNKITPSRISITMQKEGEVSLEEIRNKLQEFQRERIRKSEYYTNSGRNSEGNVRRKTQIIRLNFELDSINPMQRNTISL
eukprot:gene6824-9343_t